MAADLARTFRETLALAKSAEAYKCRIAASLDEMSEWKIVSHELIATSRELMALAEQRLRALK